MRDGEGTDTGTTTERPARGGRSRARWVAATAVALALVGGAVAVPLVLPGDDEPACRAVPEATRALAKDPSAATRALDPGDDLSRLPAVRRLIAVRNPCADGGKALGKVVRAATSAPDATTPHTLAQARAAYGVVAALTRQDGYRADVPHGMAPDVARMLAQYVVDQNRYTGPSRSRSTPAAVPPAGEQLEYGRFLAPGEAHADFAYKGAVTHVGHVLREVAEDPEAFAIVHDAERAYFAHYLERLTSTGDDPDHPPSGGPRGAPQPYWSDRHLEMVARRVGMLMGIRARHAQDGVITDLAAYDKAVRRHIRGVYRAAHRRMTSRPPAASAASRPVDGPAPAALMDGRHVLFTTLDAWARARGVPRERVAQMRAALEESYLRGRRLAG